MVPTACLVRRPPAKRRRSALFLAAAAAVAMISGRCELAAGRAEETVTGVVGEQGPGASLAFMTPKGKPRVIDFETSEGTLMSVDVSRDGKWIVFDLLGQVYRMPATGGRAECLTQGSGIALNYQPRFSPDAEHIAFVSDRSGQANVWIMSVDGSRPRPVFLDPEHRYAGPVWLPDGGSIVATRFGPTPGEGWHRRSASIWELPMSGVPRPLLASAQAQYYASSFTPDGRTLFLHSSTMEAGGASIFEVGFRVQALDMASGRVSDLSTHAAAGGAQPPAPQAPGQPSRLAYDSGGSLGAPAELAPVVSRDGRYVAFARAATDRTVRIRGHDYYARTVLFVRDLRTGAERMLLDPITKDLTNTHANFSEEFVPRFAWSADDRQILISAGGKIVAADVDGDGSQVIPFRARVHRIISGQVRRQAGSDPDDAVPVRFIQWPVASPDGRQLVFVALGRLWRMDLPSGAPTPLTADPAPDVQLTPAWSPDGTHVAFTTWNPRDRGQVWKINVATGARMRLSEVAGEYIWPTWTRDGAGVLVVRGTPTVIDARDAWNAPSGWQAVRLSNDGKSAQAITDVGTPWQPLGLGQDGRVYLTKQWDPSVAQRITLPYADPVTLELGAWILMSTDGDGRNVHVHARFPAGPASSNAPVPSPDGRWLAYTADYQVLLERLDRAGSAVGALDIDSNPGHHRPDRKRLDELGGAYLHWRNASTLEFASGNHYVTYDVDTGLRQTTDIHLAFPRDRAQGVVALTNARIITMEGDRVIDRGSLIIRDGRLTCVGTCRTEGVGQVFDLRGKTIIPGLIDVHEHIATETSGVVPLRRPSSLLALAYGVTTIVDPAVLSTSLFPLAEMTEAGRALGPRTLGTAEYIAGSVGGPGGGGTGMFGETLNLKSAADAEYEVARRAAWGAVVIKNFRQPSRQQQQWLVESARAHGLSITSEGGPLLADLGMAMDGQTGWEHYIAALPLYSDASRFFGHAGVNYSPTLSVAGFPDGAMFYYRPRAQLPHDAKFARFASAALLQAVAPRDTTPPPLARYSFPILAEGAADIMRAGGFVTIGDHGENPGIGSHWEIWAHAAAMTPLEALHTGTVNGARTVGLEHEIGSLAVGKRADLVVLNRNPLERIENTADIELVMKSGRLYDAASLEPVWPH